MLTMFATFFKKWGTKWGTNSLDATARGRSAGYWSSPCEVVEDTTAASAQISSRKLKSNEFKGQISRGAD